MSSDVLELNMVKSSVIVLSHPAAFGITNVAVLLLAVYSVPSIHVYESQADITSVAELELMNVRSSVTNESQPVEVVSNCCGAPE